MAMGMLMVMLMVMGRARAEGQTDSTGRETGGGGGVGGGEGVGGGGVGVGGGVLRGWLVRPRFRCLDRGESDRAIIHWNKMQYRTCTPNRQSNRQGLVVARCADDARDQRQEPLPIRTVAAVVDRTCRRREDGMRTLRGVAERLSREIRSELHKAGPISGVAVASERKHWQEVGRLGHLKLLG